MAFLYIYQLRNFEGDAGWNIPILFAHNMALKGILEVFLEYSSYIFYILFIQYFLNLAKDSPKINKGLTISIWCLIGFIVLDFIFQLTLGLRTALTIHNYIRTLFFIPAFWLVFYIFFNQKNKLYKYVFIGTTLLLLASIYTLIGQLFYLEKYNILGGAIKVYDFGGFNTYMYHMRTGILLEIICFAFGLSYKNSQQWKNYLALNEKVALQNKQLQKIITTPTQQKQTPDELLQKINILLEENYKTVNFSAKEMANQLHMSKSKLGRQLKSRNQLPPSNLIRQYRLEKARNLILTTDLTLSQIAHKTGFNEATYFSKSFKDYYQISPSDLRLT